MAVLWFKNVTAYRITECETEASEDNWEPKFSAKHHMEIGEASELSVGFVPVFKDYGMTLYAHEFQDHLYGTLMVQTKSVKPSVLNKHYKLALAKRKKRNPGEELTKGDKDTLKDETKRVLLRNVEADEKLHEFCVDIKKKWVFVNTSSAAVAKRVMAHIQNAVGGKFIFKPFFDATVSYTLTRWLMNPDEMPSTFNSGDTCTMTDPENKSKATLSKQDLTNEEIDTMLRYNKAVNELGLSWDEKLYFSIHETGVVKKIKVDDILLGEVDDDIHEDNTMINVYENNWMVFGPTVTELFSMLLECFPVNSDEVLGEKEGSNNANESRQEQQSQPADNTKKDDSIHGADESGGEDAFDSLTATDSNTDEDSPLTVAVAKMMTSKAEPDND